MTVSPYRRVDAGSSRALPAPATMPGTGPRHGARRVPQGSGSMTIDEKRASGRGLPGRLRCGRRVGRGLGGGRGLPVGWGLGPRARPPRRVQVEPLPAFPPPMVTPLEPAPLFGQLRGQCPVARVRMATGDEAWLVTGYDDNRQIFSDARLSRAASGGGRRSARPCHPAGAELDHHARPTRAHPAAPRGAALVYPGRRGTFPAPAGRRRGRPAGPPGPGRGRRPRQWVRAAARPAGDLRTAGHPGSRPRPVPRLDRCLPRARRGQPGPDRAGPRRPQGVPDRLDSAAAGVDHRGG